ncbi:TPA: 3-methyl-2-oxobutanoate hydroxymethyltransferase [Legionella pneumophila]|uniref:3-methyl-2-oxobutanoate hydroxymethyltransferase n=2 Tax=Legionella pneumophila TaxID=446 RepID=A0A2S6EVC6_LEGPN|nr:3-methyl-2-oxobutanoate hydroxymethyltransferase [Legionella pneumophila]TIH02793.1 3-methyl-2-oxobutanoate hydroxymethyltransferase [Legionella pneumophila]HAT6810038.1 3-methyl-2-oxobutanoate hydroxymethyltransferase [Legionella pneumophila]HAT6902174.1 3-methyl-2-oxobutanoate hydroxymethyltransferase [Legionella pneumophila]HAT6923634.1 3-methyl-2-oxobutanoate hydroxymethyltransferase [Legionella pneumophila]
MIHETGTCITIILIHSRPISLFRESSMKVHDFKLKKQEQSKISMLTCYDYPSACIIAESNIDCVLVGDSVAMAIHGHPTTIMATIEMMELHTQAVARGLGKQFLITDLPFLAHKSSQGHTVENVKRLLQAGAQAVKIEGADKDTCQTISHLVNAGIPVMGHIGLTPQSIHQLGGYKVQGKNNEQAETLLRQASALEQAGCFALVIECVPQGLAKTITDSLTIPTIGIGAGPGTDGQVLVWHDMLGLQTSFNPKFVKKYFRAKDHFIEALNTYVQQVQQRHFPANEHSF